MSLMDKTDATDAIKRVLLARLVEREGTYFDGRRWVSGADLAQSVAEQIVRELPASVSEVLGA